MQSQLYASTTAVRAPATLMRLGRRLQRAEAGRGGRDTEDHAIHFAAGLLMVSGVLVQLATELQTSLLPASQQRGAHEAKVIASWHILGNFTVRATPGCERRAADQVVRRMRRLSVPPEFVERIRATVAQATLNVVRRDADQRPATPVGILILIATEPSPEGSRPRRKHQGWGFFLISRMSESAHAEPASMEPAIELFLYPEGDASEK